MIRFSKTLPGIGRLDAADGRRIAAEAFTQVDGAVGAERQDRLARPRVDRLEEAVALEEQPPVAAVLALPVVDAARRHALQLRVDPDLLAGRRIERHERVVAREHIRDVVDDDRAELVGRVVVGRIAPRGPKLADVVPRDLRQRAVLRAVRAAAVVAPRGPRRGRLGEGHGPACCHRAHRHGDHHETPPAADVCLLQSHRILGRSSSGSAENALGEMIQIVSPVRRVVPVIVDVPDVRDVAVPSGTRACPG